MKASTPFPTHWKPSAQNTGFAQNDFNAAGGFTPNASVINLRGLGPGRTLLLINGRRANDYPFPYNGRSNFQNFNSIPAAAVQRIEILAAAPRRSTAPTRSRA